jgi:hypothetical protein
MNPNSLGDIVLLSAEEKLATVSGKVLWDKPIKAHLPGEVRFISVHNKKFWLETELDSLGNYLVAVPAGNYRIILPDAYFKSDDKVYSTGQNKPLTISTD